MNDHISSAEGDVQLHVNDATTSLPRIRSTSIEAPEKRLTLLALRLAVLEKAATGLGTLGFIWATVVLLGGFAITLHTTDFWFITIILLIEAGRIFGRSHELEWQHHATWSLPDAGINSFRLSVSDSYMLCFMKICKVLEWLQVGAAITCLVLSMMKLISRNFGDIENGDTDKRNREAALLIFYSLALAEASLFLLEKLYWKVMVTYCKVLEQVNEECEFGPLGLVSIKRFFYDAYSRCVGGSIFDGVKMDMVSFAIELLSSNSPVEQLMGARILQSFSKNPRFADDTLQKIRTTLSSVERLVEMLNWKHLKEKDIRLASATILKKLAGKKQNSLRVAGIPGAMESISSMLYVCRNSGPATGGIGENPSMDDHEDYDFCTFNHLGLLILKNLARDHENCGSTGKQLRGEIAEIVFTISNIRDILSHGERHLMLQKLGIQILTNLAMEDEATEKIGGTGGILRELLNIFLRYVMPDQAEVRTAAGEALAMLASESKQNCQRILKLGALEKLIEALEVPLLRVNAARILNNLCSYSAEDYFQDLGRVTDALPAVLKMIVLQEELQEVMVGLAARTLNIMKYEESTASMFQSGVKQDELAQVLVQILKNYQYPAARFPRIRRFTIELAIWMMKDNVSNISIFKNLGLENELDNVLDTTSELESFNIFSGTVGLRRCSTSIHLLVQTARNLMDPHGKRQEDSH